MKDTIQLFFKNSHFNFSALPDVAFNPCILVIPIVYVVGHLFLIED
ncbi:hypothetical protein SAMN06265219_102187 [Gracilimonas mengyeensis]|uniref:Uncharacterized protein n=1 Tax=Gracilimonas mengyeensis TaxID=1302730 RepID=A0A521BCR0_9BACT|nr:hypothetical protein SAMN06265219_102187 [Gracilimonas mengyeensis]